MSLLLALRYPFDVRSHCPQERTVALVGKKRKRIPVSVGLVFLGLNSGLTYSDLTTQVREDRHTWKSEWNAQL